MLTQFQGVNQIFWKEKKNVLAVSDDGIPVNMFGHEYVCGWNYTWKEINASNSIKVKS